MSNMGRQRVRDPDSKARTHLSNERTYLSWLRTGIALIALGLVAAEFLARDVAPVVPGVPLALAIAIGLVVSGIFVVVVGARRYYRGYGQIESGQFRPAVNSILYSTILLALIGLVSVIFVLLLLL